MSAPPGFVQQEQQKAAGAAAGAPGWIFRACNIDFNHRSGEIIMNLRVTFMSPMTVWKSPPSALHSLSITVSIFSGVNGNYNQPHSELVESINEAAGNRWIKARCWFKKKNKKNQKTLRLAVRCFPGWWRPEHGRKLQQSRCWLVSTQRR